MKFYDSYTFKDKGESVVKVKHRGKIYIGKAQLHPEDSWSEFTGARYAEIRAEISALKDEYKQKKHDCEECKKFTIAVSQYANFDKASPSARAMYRQLNRRIKEVNNIAIEINRKELSLKFAISQQNKLIEKFLKKYSQAKEDNNNY